jgi:NAD(P)-dependent dehydrogenase (short-subunit alcohol dehydrogenase family)
MAWTSAQIPDLSGKVAVVTGAGRGLGLETTYQLCRKRAVVVMAVRSLDRGRKAAEQVTGAVPGASLELEMLDLADLSSVAAFGTRVLSRHPRIDLLVNNAGVMAVAEGRTADGFELQFGTNHLGHFALTARLMPAILRSRRGRVVAVTSTGRFFAGDYDLSNPHLRGRYRPWQAYGISKRANLQFALELDRRLRAAGAAARALIADPGYSRTDLQATSYRSSGGASQRFFYLAVKALGASPAVGALPQLRAATDPTSEGGTLYRPRWTGFGPPVEGRVSRRMRRPSELIRLWELSEQETRVEFDVDGQLWSRAAGDSHDEVDRADREDRGSTSGGRSDR